MLITPEDNRITTGYDVMMARDSTQWRDEVFVNGVGTAVLHQWSSWKPEPYFAQPASTVFSW